MVKLIKNKIVKTPNKDQDETTKEKNSDLKEENIGKSILDVVKEGGFKKLFEVLKKTNIGNILDERGPFTVFAPSDTAFEHLSKDTLEDIMGDKYKLRDFVNFHIVPGIHLSYEFKTFKCFETLEGENVCLNYMGEKSFVNDSRVIQADILAKNGVIHVLDTVLIPEIL